MALPQSEYPLIDIEVHSLNDTFSFRPFRVKEEKLLIMGAESNNVMDLLRVIQQIITNCSFGKVNGDEIAIFDLQNIFIKLRSVSVSSTVNVTYECKGCNKNNEVELSLEDIELTFHENHSNKIVLDNNVVLFMNYPAVEQIGQIANAEKFADIFETAQGCIKEIHTENEIIHGSEMSNEEKLEFIDNLSLDEFKRIKQFFDTMPSVEKRFQEQCSSCEHNNFLYMNGYLDFFA